MTLIDSHLEQISLCAKSIGDLQFPPPKIFTNALLGQHDITTLIRDTEPHERALFSLDPNSTKRVSARSIARISRGPHTLQGGQGRRTTIATIPQHQQESAVARVLGTELLKEIQCTSRAARASRNGGNGEARTVVDIEVLLRGAEKLSSVYTVVGVAEKINTLRHRHAEILPLLDIYEEKVTKQQVRLERVNKGSAFDDIMDDDTDYGKATVAPQPAPAITDVDIELQLQEIAELDAHKKKLEEVISGIDKDLGGLMS